MLDGGRQRGAARARRARAREARWSAYMRGKGGVKEKMAKAFLGARRRSAQRRAKKQFSSSPAPPRRCRRAAHTARRHADARAPRVRRFVYFCCAPRAAFACFALF